jgi:hypothetical protein
MNLDAQPKMQLLKRSALGTSGSPVFLVTQEEEIRRIAV